MFSTITIIDYQRPLNERAKARKVVGPYKWSPSKPMAGRGFYQAQAGLCMDRTGSTIDLRLEHANGHLEGSRLRYVNGYYCDSDWDGDTLQPIIARLPHGRGYLAGWTMGPGMAASLAADIWADPKDAARAAHGVAERDAEASREYQLAEEEEDASHTVACDNCDWKGTEADLEVTLGAIPHLADRLDVGGTVPAGECPECGALAYEEG